MVMNSSKVWYVTGASQGLGLALVRKLLTAGYRVAATSRNAETLKKAVGVVDAQRFLPLSVDLGNLDAIRQSIEETRSRLGRIDVLVNNAGYGMAGTLEETDERDIRNIFEVNVLALLNVTKIVLPLMRQQRSGYIINVGSVAGFVGAPGWSVYSATKAAVAAFSEEGYLAVKDTQKRYLTANGNQPGDPRASHKVAGLKEEMTHWQSVTESADFPSTQ
jgi:short-subunit dehydrogenase